MQTHQIPQSIMDRAVLARKMRIKGDTVEELSHNLMSIYKSHTAFVGKMFSEQFSEKGKREAAETISNTWKWSREGEKLFSEETLASIPLIIDSRQAYRILKVFRDGSAFSYPSEKSIQDFSLILPKIIHQCKQIPSPGKAIENLCKFVEATGARESVSYTHLPLPTKA